MLELFRTPPARPVRLGVIGLGGIAASSHLPSLRLLQDQGWPLSVSAVADPNTMRIGATEPLLTPLFTPDARVFTDGVSLLTYGAIDAALILTPPPITVEMLNEALSRGIPALAEKPVGTYPHELDPTVALSESPGASPARIAYNRRSQPLAPPFRERVNEMRAESGAIHVEARLWRERRTDPIFYDDTMVHALDFLLWTLGPLTVERVEWWPAYHAGGLAAGLRAWLRGAGESSALTAHLDVRPACGRAIETYEALSEGRAAKLHYPVPGQGGSRPRLTLYEHSKATDLGAALAADTPDTLIAPGFAPQLAAFLRLATGEGEPDGLCTLADARRTLAVKRDVLADYERPLVVASR